MAIRPRRATATYGQPAVVLESDPVTIGDAQYADRVRGFLEVRWIDADTHVRVYRYGGAYEQALVALDTLPYAEVTAPGIALVEWPEPPPPCIQTRVEVGRSAAGSGSAEVALLQTARKD